MLNLSQLAKRAEKLITDNSTVILTAIGVTGTVVTALLTGRASYRAAAILAEESPHLEPKEKFRLVWKLYVPPMVTGSVTVACIVGANRIGNRRAAAMAAAFTLTEKAFTEYKDKVVEKLGERKEMAMRDELAQDRVNRNPLPSEIFITNGSVLCYDQYTGRYFLSDMETIRRAVNDINEIILVDHYATLTDFHERIGLPPTKVSEEVGWNMDAMLHVDYSSVLTEHNKPCLAITYDVSPSRTFFRHF